MVQDPGGSRSKKPLIINDYQRFFLLIYTEHKYKTLHKAQNISNIELMTNRPTPNNRFIE